MEETTGQTTSDRVKQLCNDLYRKGTNPSVRMILSMMPDITSTSTVHKPYKEWRDQLEANQRSLYDELGFSKEFTQSFMQEISRFSLEAEGRYQSRTQEAREQRDTALEDLERTEDKFIKQSALVEQQSKALSDKKTEIAEQQKAHAAVVQELRDQIEEQTKANADLIAANEELRTEVAKAQVQLDHNNNLVEEVKAGAVDKDKEIARLRDEVVGGLRQDNIELTKENTRLNTTLEGKDALISELKSIEPRLEAVTQDKGKLETDLAKMQQRLDDAKDDLSKEKIKAKEAIQKENELKDTIAEKSAIIKSLTKNDKNN